MNRPAQGFWQCLGKLGFDSWEAAARAIGRRGKRNGGRKTEGGPERTRPYRCDQCPKWHIASHAINKRRKRSKRMGVAE